MIRYFYYFTGWLATWLAAPSLAHASTPAPTPTQKHLAPMQDWQLPSFIAGQTSRAASASYLNGHQATAATSPAAPAKGTAVFNSKLSSHSTLAPAPAIASQPSSQPPSAPLPTQPSSSPVAGSSDPFDHRGVTHAYPESFTQAEANARKEALALRRAEHVLAGRLARLTAYWAGEGDYYTERHLSSTGIHLHGGLCAVDPSIIPYGSVVVIPGLGQFLAADTGSAVVSRAAAKEAGKTLAEKGALVIDIFFESRSEGQAFAALQPKYVPITWWTPSSTSNAAQSARHVFADEDWNKIYSKQL